MTDAQIIAMLYERDENAINELAKSYRSYCYSIAYGILGSNEDAEECLNDMLNGVWKTIPPNSPDNLKAYCGKIIRNISLNRLQANTAQKRGGATEIESIDDFDFRISSPDSVEDEIFASAIREIINKFVSSLSKTKRIIFVRKYWYLDSIEDIAHRMKLSPNNVKVILYRLREKLKIELQKGGFEIE